MKRADEYLIGEDFFERDIPSGKVISFANDPYSPTRAYLLVLSNNSMFTIYGCLRDAKCEPFLVRHIPAQVIRQFLFEAFVGCDLVFLPQEEPILRCPVLDIPTYPEPEKRQRRFIESTESSPPVEKSVELESPREELCQEEYTSESSSDENLSPETDFP